MRKVLNYTVESDGGRDAGKVFVITEMPAAQAEKWAIKIFLALAHSGAMVPENLIDMGVSGIAVMGFRALEGLKFEDAEPILDEMMQYIKIIPDPAKPQISRELVENDIEEIKTRLNLRKEVFSLNLDFFVTAVA